MSCSLGLALAWKDWQGLEEALCSIEQEEQLTHGAQQLCAPLPRRPPVKGGKDKHKTLGQKFPGNGDAKYSLKS